MKRHFGLICILVCIVFLAGCMSFGTGKNIPRLRSHKRQNLETAAKTRAAIVGKWLGEGKADDGRLRKWITDARADGTLQIQSRTYGQGGGYEDQTEAGFWGISGPVYFTIIKTITVDTTTVNVDPEDPYFYDAYEIVRINAKEFDYKIPSWGDLFKLKKVSDSFKLPEEKSP